MTTSPTSPVTLTQPAYRWHSCDLRTGRRQEVLPLVAGSGVPRAMGAMTTVELSCDLAALGTQDFWGSTVPRRTLLVLERQYPDQDTSDLPWAGVVIGRPQRGASNVASLSCVSVEGLLQRRFADTHTYSGAPGDTDAAIVTALVGDANIEGWNIQLDLAGLTTTRNLRYRKPERRTVLSCLQELAGLQNGPEWTISATWNGAGDAVVLTLVARPRLGTASSMPNAQFRYPGNVRDYNQDESHAEGEGGNAVTAIGTGQGAAQPSAVARDETRIAVEGRWESVTQSAAARTAGQLTAAAAAELALEVGGKTLFTLLADATLAPRFGIDWVFGDDVALVVDRDALSDNAPSYGHPNGLNTVARAIGWTLDIDADTIAPVLWQSSEGALT